MALQVDDGQHARFRLESQHALVGCLVLPRARTDEGGSPEVNAFMPVNVAGDEDIGDFTNDQPVLRFGGKRVLPPHCGARWRRRSISRIASTGSA